MPMGRFEKQRVQLETGEWSMVYSLEIAPARTEIRRPAPYE